jgi:Mg2+/Co2+ transporter CorC
LDIPSEFIGKCETSYTIEDHNKIRKNRGGVRNQTFEKQENGKFMCTYTDLKVQTYAELLPQLETKMFSTIPKEPEEIAVGDYSCRGFVCYQDEQIVYIVKWVKRIKACECAK